MSKISNMKYIRTKDGIYSGKGTATFFMIDKGGYIENDDIISQADTIEELCDEFVCKSKTSDFWQVSPHLNWEEYDLERFNFYGAIWTAKGLIYVAKMNDKEELELL